MANYFATINAKDWKSVSSRQQTIANGDDTVGNLRFRADSSTKNKIEPRLPEVEVWRDTRRVERYGRLSSGEQPTWQDEIYIRVEPLLDFNQKTKICFNKPYHGYTRNKKLP